MIGKKNKMGGGARGAFNYLLRAGESPERQAATVIACGSMAGTSPRELAKEWSHVRATRPSCKKPVAHFSLSLPPGQELTEEQWDKAARAFLQEMEINPDRHQWVGIKHVDREHQHLHILLNRVPTDGGNLAREKKTTTT